MIILRIEHEVLSFEGWKKAFDSDPINRRKSGVKRHHIYQPVDNSKYVIIDLAFENLEDAEATQKVLQNMMTNAVGTLIVGPSIKLLNEIESKNY
jgi:hypothetical protein